MLLAVAAFFAAAVLAPAAVRVLGLPAFWLVALVPAAVTLWALAVPTPRSEAIAWAPGLQLSLAFRMDPLALVMTLVVAGIGALILVYCGRYFIPGEQGLAQFAGVFTAFAGAMLGLVLADDLILLYVFWELTTVFSYLLIGFDAEDRTSRRAAMTAIVVTTAGGLTMLAGLITLGLAAGTFRLSEILAAPPAGTAVSVALVLILVGALTKSALVPFHFWLPGAMAAPTPVSAYLHAAAMVKAGVYLVARLAPAFAGDPVWRPIVLVFGLATMLVGAWRALRKYDLKLLLAFGTVSQLGFLVVLVGAGTRAAAQAGLYMLVAHAVFKAALFMVVGVIDHGTGTRDLRKLHGLARAMPVTCAAGCLAAASMAGIPPLAGFVGKEAAFGAFGGDGRVLAVMVAGTALTVAYSLRFVWGAFATKKIPGKLVVIDKVLPDRPPTEVVTDLRPDAWRPVSEVHPPVAGLAWPVVVLAVLSLLLGVAVPLVTPVFAAYAAAFPAGPDDSSLALWHGFTLPLLLSVVALAAGAALFAARRPVAWAQAMLHPRVDAERSYRLIMLGVDHAADQATRFTQRGSLPVYLRYILFALLLLPGGALISGLPWTGGLRPWYVPAEIIVAGLVCLAAFATTLQTWRMPAVMCAAVTGTGTATMFVLHGAPDLALTQFLTEVVTLVAFVLVLRRLPPRFVERQYGGLRRFNAALAVAVGVAVAVMGHAAINARRAAPISAAYPEAAAEAGGTNIVNIALVDLRAWDTMGESSVLLIAAAGVTGLIFVRRRPRLVRAHEATGGAWALPGQAGFSEPEDVRPGTTWLRGSETLAPERRSIMFEVVARALFHPMLVLSVYLLFSGHGTPGGGFAAGLVAGLALTVRYLAGGRYELAEAMPVGAGVCQGAGLALIVIVGLAGLALTGSVLREALFDWHLPVLGDVHFVTSLIFDIGVYLVVLGVVLDILRAMGDELDRQVEESGEEVITP
ncbi:Na+/H+ antiporter subunit A [Spongiactinospora sp. TRM90649]|uniref:Na+/H+ antiporter subunit A n=1 Tax=Spongiactinospora sp. TRM90649 TaxID=3031114 RepID=UPI0023F7EB21|nr:Na+/H+ antiporter subunit A [Spongiactinospora sp. TRM90649]MDF5756030.1 Na+/H+ antiporter subunit A [Spongiactinospora sp. TRM90649]